MSPTEGAFGSAFYETSSNGSRTSSRGCSAAPSPRRCSRSSSPASWPRRWTRTRRRRCPRVYVPNEYTVCLSGQDRGKLEGYERSLEQELSGYLLEHARRRDYDLLTRPAVELQDRRAAAAGRVRDPDPAGEAARARGRGARAGRGGPHDGLLGGPRSATAAAEAAPSTRRAPGRDPGGRLARRPPLRARRPGGDDRALEASASACSRDPNVSRRHAELRRGTTGDWQIVDLGSTNGIKVNGRRVASTRLCARGRGHGRHDDLPLRHRAVATSMDYRPDRGSAQVRLPRRPLPVPALGRAQRAQGPAPHAAPGARRDRDSTRSAPVAAPRATDAWLVVERGGGLEPGERFDLFGGLSIGRSADADVRIEDRYASGVHARIFSRGASYYVEDMNSTNGTLLNGGAPRRGGGADRPRQGADRRHRVPVRARGTR